MLAFDYVKAHNVKQAVSYLSQRGESARILNGGTDLIVQLQEGSQRASLLVDIKAIPELNQLSYDPHQGLLVGAAVSCWDICQFPAIKKYYPGLLDAVSLIGGVQIQGRASLGGNLCNASPAADSIPALIIYQATCLIAGPDGSREISVEDFCIAPGQTALRLGELLVSVRLPPPKIGGTGACYLRFTPRSEMDIAVVGVGVAVVLSSDRTTFDWARIALGAVAPTPLLVPAAGEFLRGQKTSAAAIKQAAQIAKESTRPINDMRGTIAQRKHLTAILVRRALEKAIGRAQQNDKEE